MRPQFFSAIAAALLATVSFGAVSSAEAACKRMGFLVNDYGKDGPTKDAQALLEKDIAKWAASQGISNYKVDKRDVSCELFLNFIVFDEHTCTASATVCWDEKSGGKAAPQNAKSTGPDAAAPKPSNAKADSAKTDAPKKEAAKPAAEKPAKAAKVETGAVPSTPETPKAPAATEAAAEPIKEAAPVKSEKDSSQAAAAAAERAAAAAERAAVAAERAAQAAQDAQTQSAGAASAAQPAATSAAAEAAPSSESDTAKP